jgi:molecular chaperone GrpE
MTAKAEHTEQESQAKEEETLVGEVVDETEANEEDVVLGEEIADSDDVTAEETTEEVEVDEVTALTNELKERIRERDEYKDQTFRLRAEFDNYRKRMARESAQVRKTATKNLVANLLPVMDNLQRALEHVDDTSGNLAQGMEMVLKQFCDVLQAEGIEVIAALGESFDPNLHEALTQMPSEEYETGIVMQEFLRGYRMGEYILRHSQVVVSSGPAAHEAEVDNGDGPDDGDSPGQTE